MLRCARRSCERRVCDLRGINAERYEEALSLLSTELDRNPGDAEAWFDKGRVIAVMNRGSPPDDYCDADANWIFLALGHLSEGMKRDQARVEVLIGSDAPAFAAFRETPEFKNRWTATRPLPNSDSALREFVRDHPVWNRGGPATSTREGMTLRPDGGVDLFARGRTSRIGTWKVGQGQLVITVGKRTTAYPLTRTAFFVRGGTLQFPILTLGREWTIGRERTMGRILHDCTF
ncbi:MAG: hypothetical protein ABWY07_07585 [Burkholderiales bacterium]